MTDDEILGASFDRSGREVDGSIDVYEWKRRESANELGRISGEVTFDTYDVLGHSRAEILPVELLTRGSISSDSDQGRSPTKKAPAPVVPGERLTLRPVS